MLTNEMKNLQEKENIEEIAEENTRRKKELEEKKRTRKGNY